MKKHKVMDEKFMRFAIEKARKGIKDGQTPFGACIVRGDKVVSCAHNAVWKNTDITAHAEICAIRDACRKLKKIDLSGCVIYSTCEPCPMCFSAIHWARIGEIVYGANIEDAERFGFNELCISNNRLSRMSKKRIEITGDFLRRETLELFEIWARNKNKRAY